ncbi:MAG TPA: hypothetical protein VF456_02165 [Vicinamibacterales bacterium]
MRVLQQSLPRRSSWSVGAKAGLLVAVFGASSLVAFGQQTDAPQVLAAARTALGGEKNLDAVKTFVANGRTRQLRGNNLVPIEFEINCELPDRFVRKDEIPAQDTDVTVSGFSGDTLIQFPMPGAGRGGPGRGPAPEGRGAPPSGDGRAARGDGGGRGALPMNPAQQRLNAVKQDFARLMLGVFATSFPTYPLTFKYAGIGEAPEGKADVLEVTGPGNFSARLVVQQDTHLPVMLMWQQPAPGQPAPAEYRMYYADFRDVNGVKWPFRIRRAVAGQTIEETTFDRIRINAKIDARKFETPK